MKDWLFHLDPTDESFILDPVTYDGRAAPNLDALFEDLARQIGIPYELVDRFDIDNDVISLGIDMALGDPEAVVAPPRRWLNVYTTDGNRYRYRIHREMVMHDGKVQLELGPSLDGPIAPF